MVVSTIRLMPKPTVWATAATSIKTRMSTPACIAISVLAEFQIANVEMLIVDDYLSALTGRADGV